nr:hypothetical protein [uncultured Methanoregula sp.]
MKNFLINFDFEEVSSAVYRNAEIWKLKKNQQDVKISVLVPSEFTHLFFHADKIYEIENKIKYSEILEYKPDKITEFKLNNFLKIYSKLIKKIANQKIRFILYHLLYITPRQEKFLLRSGLLRKCLRYISTKEKIKFIRVSTSLIFSYS